MCTALFPMVGCCRTLGLWGSPITRLLPYLRQQPTLPYTPTVPSRAVHTTAVEPLRVFCMARRSYTRGRQTGESRSASLGDIWHAAGEKKTSGLPHLFVASLSPLRSGTTGSGRPWSTSWRTWSGPSTTTTLRPSIRSCSGEGSLPARARKWPSDAACPALWLSLAQRNPYPCLC